MRLKQWLKEVKGKMGQNDVYRIYYKVGKQPITINQADIKRHPLILEADIVDMREYESECMNFTFTSYAGKGKLTQYVCEIDSDQAKISLKS